MNTELRTLIKERSELRAKIEEVNRKIHACVKDEAEEIKNRMDEILVDAREYGITISIETSDDTISIYPDEYVAPRVITDIG